MKKDMPAGATLPKGVFFIPPPGRLGVYEYKMPSKKLSLARFGLIIGDPQGQNGSYIITRFNGLYSIEEWGSRHGKIVPDKFKTLADAIQECRVFDRIFRPYAKIYAA